MVNKTKIEAVAMNRVNWPLVTDEPVEFEEKPVEVQDLEEITGYMLTSFGILEELIGCISN